jgi:hypothetical protein
MTWVLGGSRSGTWVLASAKESFDSEFPAASRAML